jgi:hypothetical protein
MRFRAVQQRRKGYGEDSWPSSDDSTVALGPEAVRMELSMEARERAEEPVVLPVLDSIPALHVWVFGELDRFSGESRSDHEGDDLNRELPFRALGIRHDNSVASRSRTTATSQNHHTLDPVPARTQDSRYRVSCFGTVEENRGQAKLWRTSRITGVLLAYTNQA